MFAASAPAAAQQADFGLLSDGQLRIFQRDLARGYFGSQLLADPVVDLYLERVFAKIESPERTAIFAVNDSKVNALAAWGNVLLIYAGLISFAQTEGELLGVLAHEAGHTVQDHFTRLPDKLVGPTALATTALLVGIFTYAKNPELSDALIGSAIGGLQSQTYAQVRIYEREADGVALQLLNRAGIGSDGLLRVLAGLGRSSSGAPEYLSTHPISGNRVAALTARARQFPTHPEPAQSPDLGLIQERIDWLAHRAGNAVEQQSLSQLRSDYSAVVAVSEEAPAAAKRLARAAVGNWIIAQALASYHADAGRLEQANDLLAQALAEDPGNRVLIAQRLDVLAGLRDQAAATLMLGKLSPQAGDHPLVAQAEARMWQKLGNRSEFRIALARANYLDGRPPQARSHIEKGREGAASDQQAAKLDRIEHDVQLLEQALQRIAGQ